MITALLQALVDGALAASIGHLLFTILVHHPAERENERFYTNRPAEYPVGGRKPVTDAPWMRQVIGRGEPYIGRTLGTLNLLHKAGYYDETDVPVARLFAALALPGLMMIAEK